MPFPGDDGHGHYDGSSELFDGVIQIGLELRRGGAAIAPADWIKLSHCGVEPDHPEQVPAFTGSDQYSSAQGFGKFAKGGRYGHVYTVTSTGDDPDDPTTLRYAVESPVPRTIVFALEGDSGIIELDAPLVVRAPRMTIAGQTAFRNGAAGICLKDNGLIIEADDVVVRHLRIRPGEAGGGNCDAITIGAGSTRVIIDHVSTSFSTDTLIDVTGNNMVPGRMVTVQNCIMAWPLDKSIHWETDGHLVHPNGRSWEQVHAGQDPMPPHPDPTNPPPGWKQNAHGYGSLIRAGYGARITYWRNLYAHNRGRCPRPVF
jgi:hypothetical protein